MKRVATKVAALLVHHPKGLTSEEIQKLLPIQKTHLAGPIALGLSDGTFSKKGERRGTRYFARSAKPAGGGDGAGIKKPKK